MSVCRNLTVACGLLLAGSPAKAGAPTSPDDGKVVAALASADRVIEDVKYIVVDLNKDEKSWKDGVYPNLEVWLFGVDQKLPVGVDVIFDGGSDAPWRMQSYIPMDDEKGRNFRQNNLNPIDISTKPVPGKKNLYKLGGVKDGFLRVTEQKPVYASMSLLEVEVPANMPHPKEKLDTLLEGGLDVSARWMATSETADKRDKGFAKLKQNLLEAIKKRPEESAAAFELRRLTVEQQSDRITKLMTNSAELKVDWICDPETKRFEGNSRLIGLPNSDVAQTIAKIGSEKSRFAKVKPTDGAVMTGRILMPLSEKNRDNQTKFYQAWLAAWKEGIDDRKETSAEEKQARKDMAERVVKVLTDGLALGWIDTYGEMVSSDGGLFTAVMGIRVQDSKDVISVLEVLPKVQAGWKVELNIGEEQGVALHKLDLKEQLPSSLKEYFGDSGLMMVGTGDQVMWVAAGPGAETAIKSAINSAAAANGEEVPADPLTVTMKMHPVLKFLNAVMKDEDIEIVRSLNQHQLLQRREEAKPAREQGRVNRGALKNFNWQDPAIEALAAGNDDVEITIRKNEEALLGHFKVQEGMMRATGKIVAKFCMEVLQ